MKKSITVAIILLLVCGIAYAEIGLSSMSNDELIALKTQIVQELIDRGAMKSANVPAGEYIIGKDIPAGEYSISTSQVMATIIFGDYNMYVVSPKNDIGRVVLKEGDSFQCTASIVLTKYTGISFD